MKEYEEMGNGAHDAFDAPNASATTTPRGEKHEGSSQSGQMVPWTGAESETNGVGSLGILRATSGNATKKLKTRAITRAGKSAQAIILKQIATEECQAEKGQMKEWKENITQEVALELQAMRQMHEETVEAQRQSFQVELKHMGGKEQQLELEVKALKFPTQHSARKTPAAKTAVPSSSNTPKRMEDRDENQESQPIGLRKMNAGLTEGSQSDTGIAPNPPSLDTRPCTEKRDYASVAASKPVKSSEQPWTKVSYGTRKPKGKQLNSTIRQEQLGQRILFPQNAGQEKSEADLMLALNEALQQVGEETSIRFTRVRYAPSGAISALLSEKADAGQIIPRRSNLLIRAVKAVDPAVVRIEILEHWQRLKVHGMPLERYLGEGKMELLKREVESAMGIQLKSVPRWLISENRLREQQESSNKRGSAIVITVSSESEAKRLCASGLRFGGILRVVEKYWESRPSSVCMTCCGIGHERMGKCGDRQPRCVICAGPHKLEDHQCGVTSCHKGKEKVSIHVTVKCVNCGGGHSANSN